MSYSDYKAVASENNGPAPGGAPEGMAPSLVNDVIRELMASVKKLSDDVASGTLLPASLATQAPPGAVSAYAGAVQPSGWLLCNGQAVSRTTYPNLFAAISTIYGAGDGSTTFNVPDLRGRSIFGCDGMLAAAANRVTVGVSGIVGVTLGATGGSEHFHAHHHTGTVGNGGSHSHSGTAEAGGVHGHALNITTAGAHQHGQNVGQGTSGSVTGWNVTSNATEVASSLKTAVGGDHTHAGSTALDGGAHTHAVSVNAAPDHSHTLTINGNGQGASQNMPPAMMLNWIIKL